MMDCFCKLGAQAALNNKMQFQGLQKLFNPNSEIKEVCCVGSVEIQIEESVVAFFVTGLGWILE